MSSVQDPGVLFAAERTLLSWNRTRLSLMAFGFVIERFALCLQFVGKDEIKVFQRQIAFSVGVVFIVLGTFLLLYSVIQHRRFLRTPNPGEVPREHPLYTGIRTNVTVGVLGIGLILYPVRGIL